MKPAIHSPVAPIGVITNTKRMQWAKTDLLRAIRQKDWSAAHSFAEDVAKLAKRLNDGIEDEREYRDNQRSASQHPRPTKPGNYNRHWSGYVVPVVIRFDKTGELEEVAPSGLVSSLSSMPDAEWTPITTINEPQNG